MSKENYFARGMKLFCVLAAGLFLLPACGKTEEKKVHGTAAVAGEDVTGADFEYQRVAESENGYYFWECTNQDQFYPRLMFMDKESGRVVPLCSKPDCGHGNEECNACFPELDFGADGIDKTYLQYYEGNLYAIGLSSDDYVVLFRIKPDGSEWEINTRLYRTDFAATGHWMPPEILIDGGYIYFVDWKQTVKKLERMPIGGGTAEKLFEGDGDASAVNINRIKGNAGYLFFQVFTHMDDVPENRVRELYRYDTATGQCELVKEGYGGPYSIKDDCLYYVGSEGLCCYSIQDETTEILMDRYLEVPNITLTKDYIVLCDQMADHSLLIYDYEGNEICTVPNTLGLFWYFGGNSDRLFGQCVADKGYRLCFLDLTRPLDELRWEELKAD